MITGSLDRTIRLWERNTGKELRRMKGAPFNKLRPQDDCGLRVAFSTEGRVVAAQASGANDIRLWETATGEPVLHFAGIPYDFKEGVADAPPRRRGGHGDVRLELAGRGIHLSRFSQGTYDAFAPDGRTLAYLSGRRVHLVETATGDERYQSHDIDWVTAVAFAPDMQHLAWAETRRGMIHLWKLADLAGHAAPKLGRRDLETCWANLNGSTADAYRAGWRLSAAPAEAIPFLCKQAGQRVEADPKRVAQWIGDLDSACFAARQRAVKELETIGRPALGPLRKVLAGKPSLEFTRRAEPLVATISAKFQAETLRVVRAVEVLERIGTPQARRGLEDLAESPLIAVGEAEEAVAAALQRLKRAAER